MDPTSVIDAGLAIATIYGLVWLGWSVWPRLAVVIARQSLFEIRDDLFYRAASGELDFADPKYQRARNVLNAMIRKADHATLWRYWCYSRVLKRNGMTTVPRPMRELLESKDTPAAIRKALKSADRVYLRLLVFRSPVLAGLVVVMRTSIKIRKALFQNGSTKQTLEQRFRDNASMATDADIAVDIVSRRSAAFA